MKYVTIAEMEYLARRANEKLLPLVNDALAAGRWTNGANYSWNLFSARTNPLDDFSDLLNPQPQYKFDPNQTFSTDRSNPYNLTHNWLFEFNRIRGDAFVFWSGNGNDGKKVLPTVDDPFYKKDFRFSGKWIVGVNDPTTYGAAYINIGGVPDVGFLTGNSGDLQVFKNVEFWFAHNDAPGGLTVTAKQSIPQRTEAFAHATPITTVDIPLAASFAAPTKTLAMSLDGHGSLNGSMTFQITFGLTVQGLNNSAIAAPSAAPSVGSLNLTASFGTIAATLHSYAYTNDAPAVDPITGDTSYHGTATAIYDVTLTFSAAALAGNQAVNITADVPAAGWSSITGFQGTGEPTATDGVFAAVLSNAFSGVQSADGIHPSSAIQKIVCGDYPTESFTVSVNGAVLFTSDTRWQLSDASVKGVWLANTFPVPAINCFLNQDIPPYQLDYYSTHHAKIDGTGDAPMADVDSAFSPAPLQPDGSNGSVGQVSVDGKRINTVYPAITPQPSKWIVKRDSDLLPLHIRDTENNYSFGDHFPFDAGVLDPWSGTTGAGASGNWSEVANVDGYRLTDAVRVFIGLFKPGSKAGWTNGIFSYGTPTDAGDNLKLVFADNGSYDANNPATLLGSSLGGIVEITGADLAAVRAGGLYVAVVNTNTGEVSRGCSAYVEIVYDDVRAYLKNGVENRSFFQCGFDDTGTGGQKPIPQNGYCVFKLRATRKPEPQSGDGRIRIVPSSGAALTVTVGQWKNNGSTATLNRSNPNLTFVPFKAADGVSDLILTIPADARDSGDVDCFIPVLSGNEIVYQCTERVMVEAWVNFQPVFFNPLYGSVPVAADTVAIPYTHYNATVKQYAFMVLQQTPYGADYNHGLVYPLCRAAWTDLVKMLGGDPNMAQSQDTGSAGSTDTGAGNDYPTAQI